MGTVAFDSQQSMDATATTPETSARGSPASRATVERVDEMEMVFAHLHVPEMA